VEKDHSKTRPTREFFPNVSGWLIQSWATAVKKISSEENILRIGMFPKKSKAQDDTKTPKIPVHPGFDSNLRIHSFGVDFRRVFGQAKPLLINFYDVQIQTWIQLPSPKPF
jgi:hypothetical protein